MNSYLRTRFTRFTTRVIRKGLGRNQVNGANFYNFNLSSVLRSLGTGGNKTSKRAGNIMNFTRADRCSLVRGVNVAHRRNVTTVTGMMIRISRTNNVTADNMNVTAKAGRFKCLNGRHDPNNFGSFQNINTSRHYHFGTIGTTVRVELSKARNILVGMAPNIIVNLSRHNCNVPRKLCLPALA